MKPQRFRLCILLGLGMLVLGCGGSPTTTPPQNTQSARHPRATATPESTATITPTPGITRLAYPWKMVLAPRNTPPWNWLPDKSVAATILDEQTSDINDFWRWIGFAKPDTVLHFQPDPSRVSLLVTPSYAATVQKVLTYLQSSGRLITYASTSFRVSFLGCEQDGLRCKVVLALGETRKTIFDTSTGQMLSEDPQAVGSAPITLVYSQEAKRWQVDALQIVLTQL
jgi:hypothetical protein